MSFDVYQRNSFDLISIIKTPGIGGEALKAANYADLTSKGAEALIGGTIIRKQDWSWRTNVTVGYK